MGFWSSLAKVAAPIGAGVATVMTGGAASPLLPMALSLGGKAVADMAGGAAANRGETDKANLTRDATQVAANRNFEDATVGREDLKLRQQESEQKQQAAAYQQALRSALAMNTKDFSFNRPAGIPNITFAGGARPSALGAQGGQAAELMNNLALKRLMNPVQAAELAPVEKFKASEPTKASFWEKIAGPIGAGASILGGVMGARGANQGLVATASDFVDPVEGDG